ncbi:MAG: HNH endonuclease [Acidobacteria bacterium]|nr:MAG: HNH endonuclease [Acidobacteriota bacterium]
MNSSHLEESDDFRRIVALGKNTASYKFALAQSLLELGATQADFVALEDLALPFATRIADHLARYRQGVMQQSRFLSACHFYNAGRITIDDLRNATVELGFRDVISAFHLVGGSPTNTRFYVDERRGAGVPGLRLTDAITRLAVSSQTAETLDRETEGRWNLVENAWQVRLEHRTDLVVDYDAPTDSIVDGVTGTRKRITHAKWPMSSYQGDRCFYCQTTISILPGRGNTAHVDHYFPHSLMARGFPWHLDGPWNLVLACSQCNAGSGGKFARIPSEKFLAALAMRNESLIASQLPLRESIISVTGGSEQARRRFLKSADELAANSFGLGANRWRPP